MSVCGGPISGSRATIPPRRMLPSRAPAHPQRCAIPASAAACHVTCPACRPSSRICTRLRQRRGCSRGWICRLAPSAQVVPEQHRQNGAGLLLLAPCRRQTAVKLALLPAHRSQYSFHLAPLQRAAAVGEFRQLVLWALEDDPRCERVKRMLKLAKGWEEARDHVLKVCRCWVKQAMPVAQHRFQRRTR